MADSSYIAKVYMKQGSTELVVASGGVETVESGGRIAIQDGGFISFPKVTEVVGTAADAFGLSICGSTKVKKIYTLGAPKAGVLKAIEFTVTSATGYVHAGSTSYAIEDSLSSGKWIKAVRNGSALLIGASSTKYILLSLTTSVSHTTSST